MYKIGYRTLKTAIGTMLAMTIAEMLHLKFSSSAGILVILCVQNTKRKSLEASIHRFLGCLLVIVFSWVFFEAFGYNPLAIGLLLLFFIPTAVTLHIPEGISTSSVIVMHLYSLKSITWAVVLNEFFILTIGIGMALLVNLYMPSVEKDLKRYQQNIEENFKKLLLEMAAFLRNQNRVWDGRELLETEKLFEEAVPLAFREMENRYRYQDNEYYRYFRMRKQQFEILMRVMPLVAELSCSYQQARMFASFIESVANAIRPSSTGLISLYQLQEMKELFREMPLPQTREEFEIRASLAQLVYEMEQFLIIKGKFKGKHKDTA
ncbi:aromatic acid exporter family protein [Bacillus sp. 165]|uniref:aromatic acid exporter family protein n=1 Tax=Bacillus sp. 165 TaxID=1529117 RepID=UPI001AD96E3D|nr:aromatic acid exporter family protein [Bacillus sp. 165]MBO9129746.1 aromatic acid exporter family protein [Bacillus sp. 165]